MVLRDVNFRIDHGEFTGLIGSNGAGKTTLLRVLLGLQDVVRGRVLVHGEPMTRSNSSVGYVPQKVLFESDVPVRVRDFVALGSTEPVRVGATFAPHLRTGRRNARIGGGSGLREPAYQFVVGW